MLLQNSYENTFHPLTDSSIPFRSYRHFIPVGMTNSNAYVLNQNKKMRKQYQYYVYIAGSISKKIYIGVTNNLPRRIYEHKKGLVDGFTKKYKIKKLVYYEETNNIYSAIEREKQLKKWRREKKIKLIEKDNSKWKDLFSDL